MLSSCACVTPAKPSAGKGFRLIVAGVYGGDNAFPFNIIDQGRKDILDESMAKHIESTNIANRALDDFNDALRTDQAYMA